MNLWHRIQEVSTYCQGEWKDGAISVIMRNMSKAGPMRGWFEVWDLFLLHLADSRVNVCTRLWPSCDSFCEALRRSVATRAHICTSGWYWMAILMQRGSSRWTLSWTTTRRLPVKVHEGPWKSMKWIAMCDMWRCEGHASFCLQFSWDCRNKMYVTLLLLSIRWM